jgi:hypothetical protein
MRHTSLPGQPKPVPLLPSSVVSPAALGLLVPATRLPHRLTTRLAAAGARAVSLPAIAVRAHHHLASASVAAQQSSVVRGSAASPTDRRARCDSSLEALYSWVCGARPPWRQRARLRHRFGPAADFFSAADYRPAFSPPRLFRNLTTDHNSSATITFVHHTQAVAGSHVTDRLDSRPRLMTLSTHYEPRPTAGITRVSRDIHFPSVKGHPVSRTTPGVPFTW